MKTNFISDVTKIIIFAATIIVVCVLCAIGFKTANEGKSAVNAGTTQINAMSSEYQDINKSIYDGSTILGSELVNLINKTVEKGKEEYLAIRVKTGAGSTTDYNYSYTNSTTAMTENANIPSKDKNASSYINRSAQFIGKVHKDENKNIVCISFEQIK